MLPPVAGVHGDTKQTKRAGRKRNFFSRLAPGDLFAFLFEEMRIPVLVSLLGLSVLSGPLLRASSLLEDLSAAQVGEVARGGQVVLLEEVGGHPWPKVRLFQKVEATPEEVAAVFFDYKNAKEYVPKLLKSEISRQVTPCVLEVDYGVDVPILPDEFYTVRNTLRAGEDGSYTVSWNLLKALQTKSSEGNLRIERWKDGAVIRYTNFVTPGSVMARLLKTTAIDQMRNTVRAIVTRVEKQKNECPETLKSEIHSLQEALQKEPSQ